MNSPTGFEMLSTILSIGLGLIPIFAVIWLFAWMKDIRADTKKIKDILQKRFPEDFKDEEDYFPIHQKIKAEQDAGANG